MRACGESAGKLTEPILGAIQGAHTGSHWSAAASSAPHSQSGGGARGGPAYPVAISLGNDGAAIFLMPSRNLAVITLGRTVAGSERCPVFVEDVHDGTASGGNGNENGRGTSSLGMFGGVNGNAAGMGEDPAGGRRDDTALLRMLWGAIAPAMQAGGADVGVDAPDTASSFRSSGDIKQMVRETFQKSFDAGMGSTRAPPSSAPGFSTSGRMAGARSAVEKISHWAADASSARSTQSAAGMGTDPTMPRFSTAGDPRAVDAQVRRLTAQQVPPLNPKL